MRFQSWVQDSLTFFQFNVKNLAKSMTGIGVCLPPIVLHWVSSASILRCAVYTVTFGDYVLDNNVAISGASDQDGTDLQILIASQKLGC